MTTFTADDMPIFLLVLARVAGMIAVAPVFGSPLLPAGLKVGIALVFSVVFFPIVPHAALRPCAAEWIPALAVETAVGLAIGLTASLLFAAVQAGGALIDQELGLSLANAMDPSAESVSLVAQFKLFLASAVYLLVDGHHLLLSALADSYRVMPMGGTPTVDSAGRLAAVLGSGVFVGAVKVAAPALVAVFAVTVAMAFVARAMPEMGAFVTALPLRISVGLVALAVGMAAFVSGFAASVREGVDLMERVLFWLGGRA